MEKFGIKNHITIPGFAVSELGLSGTEAICFSLIYGFCQDGKSEFYGSISYIMSALNLSRANTINVIKRLTEKKLITKRLETINGVKCCHYSISEEVVSKQYYQYRNDTKGSTETIPRQYRNSTKGSTETIPNNIIDNNNDNIKDIPADDPLSPRWAKFQIWMKDNCPEVLKMKYPITREQFGKLIEQYSTKVITERLTEMNNWAPLRKRNVSAYQTLINWIKKDNERTKNNANDTAGRRADATLGTNFRPSDI